MSELDYIEDIEKLQHIIETLQQENHQLKATLEMYENGVYFSSENDKLKEENTQLRIEISAIEEDYRKLEDNWNKLKEWVNKHYDYYMNNEDYIGGRLCFTDMKDKMQKLESGVSNVG